MSDEQINEIQEMFCLFCFALSWSIIWPITCLFCIIQVLEVLSSSTELVDLLYKVDIAYHSKLVTSPSTSSESDDVIKYVPSIREQLKVGYS